MKIRIIFAALALASPAAALQYPNEHFGGLTLDVPLAVISGGIGNSTGNIAGLNFGGVALSGNLCLLNASCTWTGSQAFPSITLSTALPVGSGGLGNSTGDLSGLSVTREGGIAAPLAYLQAENPIPAQPPCLVGDSITVASQGPNQYVFTASGGTGPYTITVSGLPTGINYASSSPAVTFTNVGYVAGTYPITVSITDSASHTGTYNYNLVAPIWMDFTFTPVSNSGTLTLAQTAYNYEMSDRGPAFWINFLSGGAIKIPRPNIFAKGGDTTSSVLARMSQIVAAAPQCGSYAVMIGTNDLSTTLSTIESNIWNPAAPSSSIVGQLLATGRPVYLQLVLPRSLSSGAGRYQLFALDRWMKSLSGTVPGLRIVDGATAYGDPLAPDGAPRSYNRQIAGQYGTPPYTYSASGLPSCVSINTSTGVLTASGCSTPSTQTVTFGVTDTASHSGSQPWTMTINPSQPYPISMAASGSTTGTLGIVQYLDFSYDYLHPKTAGAYAAFKPLTDALMAAVPAFNAGAWNLNDAYDATNNPNGNLIANGGQMVFSAGTGTSSGRASGVVPDGWSAFSGDGGCSLCTYTGTLSAGTLADGTPASVITMGGTALGGYDTILGLQYLVTGLPSWSTGDSLIASCRIEVSGAQHISNPLLSVYYTAGGVYTLEQSGPVNGPNYQVSDIAPPANYSGWLSTPLPAPAFKGSMSGIIQLLVGVPIWNVNSGAIGGVVKVGACSINHG